MQFFDDKQEVMDVIITPFGKHLMSLGRFNPEFYAFFDDDILYDSEWAGISSEVQNNIEGRIQQETPRIKQPSVYTGVESSVNTQNTIIRDSIDLSTLDANTYVIQDTTNEKIYNQEALQQYGDRFEFLSTPLGRSAQSSKNLPAWGLSMLRGEISSSQSYYETSDLTQSIPQINVDLNYKVYVNTISIKNQEALVQSSTTVDYSGISFPLPGGAYRSQNVDGEIMPQEFSDMASRIFDDGTFFSIRNGRILIDLLEENVDFKKENFDIQVYISGPEFDGPNGEHQQLYFNNNPIEIQDEDMERYLTIRLDDEITSPLVTNDRASVLKKLALDPAVTTVISTREFLVRDIYAPQEDICD